MNEENARNQEALEKADSRLREPAVQSQEDIAQKLGLQWIDKIEIALLDRDLVSRTSFQFAKANVLLPIKVEDGELVVVSANPLNVQPLDDLRLVYDMPVKIVVADADVVMEAVNKVYDLSADSANQIIDDIAGEENLDALVSGLPVDLLETSAEAPVIRLVNSIMMQAAKEKASDIHFESYERELAVRFRIDGTLKNIIKPPKRLQSLIVSRVKIMSGLDIAEKRLPQDGRLKIIIAGKEIDVRVSVVPTSHGERVVMRLLDKTTMLLNFEQIGMDPDVSARLKKLIRLPHGVILVSGPTGSGKTTTLYAALSHINSPDKNIITVEDPVEYQLPGIGQMPVNAKIGLTFASGLRSILRQDPDVIMVGEIRDQETAQIGIQASLTGHLVFSTIHTNDAAGAITRLVDMGIEPFLISSSLTATLAQRLVRVLCPACKAPYEPRKEHLAELGISENDIPAKTMFYRPQGCEECGMLGYQGRMGVFELLIIDDEIRSLIVQKADSSMVKQLAVKRGFVTMRENAAKAVASGLTSLEEVVRVTLDID
ncbi:General secretion pathway protein E [hydrothermal vent metagenome]|uniref:protein-secreting ATPase n=1 Tax=hydrothermal vent metagenome TaxID=652676 RepID=A0A3B1BFL6_9ZZZZ